MARRYVLVRFKHTAPEQIRKRLSKALRGTTAVIKGKKYRSKGLVQKSDGIVLCPGTYLIPVIKLSEFLDGLERLKLKEYIEVKETCICTCP